MPDSHLLQEEGNHNPDCLDSVSGADAKVYARSLREIARLNRNLGDIETESERLGNHLRIEDKVVGIQQERHSCEQPAAKGTEAAVAVCQMRSIYKIFRDRQHSVGNEFPDRHSTLKGHAVHNARTDDHVGFSIDYRTHKFRNEPRIVLMVRMQHNDDIRPKLECFQITGLLVAAVAAILDVDHYRQAQGPRYINSLILTDIVDEDDIRDEILRNVRIGLFQRFGGVVGRQDNDDSRTFVHGVSVHPLPLGEGEVRVARLVES